MSLRNLYGRAFVPLGRKGNPIRCDGAQGQHFYLDRLRDPNGNGIEYQRVGAAGQGPYGRLLDEYVIQDGGPLGRSLFLDMYHPGYSETKAPEGLFIVNYLSGKHDLKLPKDADFAEIERHAWRIAKAFKDDAKPLSTIREMPSPKSSAIGSWSLQAPWSFMTTASRRTSSSIS